MMITDMNYVSAYVRTLLIVNIVLCQLLSNVISFTQSGGRLYLLDAFGAHYFNQASSVM